MERVSSAVLVNPRTSSHTLVMTFRVVGKTHSLPSVPFKVWTWKGRRAVLCYHEECRVCRHLELPDFDTNSVTYRKAEVAESIRIGEPLEISRKLKTKTFTYQVMLFGYSMILSEKLPIELAKKRALSYLEQSFDDIKSESQRFPATWWDAVKIQVFRRPGMRTRFTRWQKLTTGLVVDIPTKVTETIECKGDCFDFLERDDSGREKLQTGKCQDQEMAY